VSIESQRDLDGLRAAGRVVALTLRAMAARVVSGITTAELDEVGAASLHEHGACSAPRLAYGFPGATCISVSEEAAHGVPGPRRLRAGDLVKMDVSAELDGYVADACITVPVGQVAPGTRALCRAARAALDAGIAAARAGVPVSAIGRAVEDETRRRGFDVIRELTGHGVGRAIHEPPTVPHFDDPNAREPLEAGLVLTIEPALTAGGRGLVTAADGWTLRTADGALTAQFEHTVVIGREGAQILTAA
jgi:methionyl aminopeptidase